VGKGTKILGIGVGVFIIFVIIGIAYESSTGLNMITGEKKTSGVGADKWIQQEEPKSESITQTPTYVEPKTTSSSCDSSYPSVCIPFYPPDLDCGEINYTNFRVIGNDPHGFDRDNDGIGCEK